MEDNRESTAEAETKKTESTETGGFTATTHGKDDLGAGEHTIERKDVAGPKHR